MNLQQGIANDAGEHRLDGDETVGTGVVDLRCDNKLKVHTRCKGMWAR